MKLRIGRWEWERVRRMASERRMPIGRVVEEACKRWWRHVDGEVHGRVECTRGETTVVDLNLMHEGGVVRACLRRELALYEVARCEERAGKACGV